MSIDVTKTGYHIAQAKWGNDAVTVLKDGFQIIVSAFPDGGVGVAKAGIQYVTTPIFGARFGVVKPYVVFERQEDARITAMRAYVIFRPTPPPPRKTIVVIGPGPRFGGSGQEGRLIGTIEQTQETLGTFSVGHLLSSTMVQSSTFEADLFVDNAIEDVWLEGIIEQLSTVDGAITIPHTLSGEINQETAVEADLFVDNAIEDVWLEGIIEQAFDYAGSINIPQNMDGTIEQTQSVSADMRNPSLYRYWRVNVSANNGDASFSVIGEIEMNTAVGGTPMDGNDITGGKTYFASTSDPGSPPVNAFNDTYTSNSSPEVGRYWTTLSGSPNSSIGVDLGVGNVADVLQVRILPDRSLTRTPKDFTIQASNDGSTWVTKWSVTDQTGWAYGTWRTFVRP